MKIYMNRSPRMEPWGGGNMFVSAAHKEFLSELSANPHEIDIALVLGLSAEGSHPSLDQLIQIKIFQNLGYKIVLRVNENDARKGTKHLDSYLLSQSKFVDHTIFVSEYIRDYFLNLGWNTPNSVLINGVDRDIFHPGEKFNNGKVNLVTHHWSDNRLKGFDIYDRLDEFVGENNNFTFTYIGRSSTKFKNSKIIAPLYGVELGKELSKYDVYVSASRHDPGPNHILEALACELPTYVHVDGGGCVEFADPVHVYRSYEGLLQILNSGVYTNNFSTLTSWQQCMYDCRTILENL